jgi:uncharacterized protein (TIGR02246 family)
MRATVIAIAIGVLAASSLGGARLAAQSAAGGVEARLQASEDREAIRALFANYGRTLDARDFAGFAQLFARDAEYVGGGTAKGPDAIRALLESLLKANAAPVSGRDFHLFSNETIEVKGDQATAVSKGAFVVTSKENKPEILMLATYRDQLVREDGHWKFKRREVRGDIPAPAAPSR